MSTWRPDRRRRAEVDPRPVAESLGRLAWRVGAPPPEVLTVVFAHWEEVVGPAVADHATPVSLRRGVLTVAVDQPAWATQLRLLSGLVMDRLAEATGGAAQVRELVVTVRR